jgi:CRISPR-associated endonuclease Cas2
VVNGVIPHISYFKMNFFISYDISDDKRRLHLSKLLLRSGCRRVQKSVFIAIDFERREMLALKTKVDKLLNIRYPRICRDVLTEGSSLTDSLLYIPLDNDAIKDVVWQGNVETWLGLWKKDKGKFF